MMPELNRIYEGDNREILAAWPDAFLDSVVTDPPYELGFMGKSWDSTGIAYDVDLWRQVLRVMKPGAHLLAFCGTRTYHRMACAIEDAGFEIRDQLQWIYGTGFPKSLDVAKSIDKKAGHWRGRAGKVVIEQQNAKGKEYERTEKGDPVTAAAAWEGWGTALKPANEPIALARKPLAEDTVADNVARWGTGALNIKACRIGDDVVGWGGGGGGGNAWKEGTGLCKNGEPRPAIGRWPSNVLFNEYAAGLLDGKAPDASKFFYVAKPDTAERNMGLGGGPKRKRDTGRADEAAGGNNPRNRGAAEVENFHPTVKPVDLISYLIQLVTPRGGVVLDPFMGSGTAAIAASRLGNPWLGTEITPEYIEIAEKRVAAETAQGRLL